MLSVHKCFSKLSSSEKRLFSSEDEWKEKSLLLTGIRKITVK